MHTWFYVLNQFWEQVSVFLTSHTGTAKNVKNWKI